VSFIEYFPYNAKDNLNISNAYNIKTVSENNYGTYKLYYVCIANTIIR